MMCGHEECTSLIILYSLILCSAYTLVVLIGVYISTRNYSYKLRYIEEVKDILEELISLVGREEEDNRKEYPLTLNLNNLQKTEEELLIMENKLTLTDLLTQEPTEEGYEEVLDVLTELAIKLYKDYKFLIAKSPNETEQSNFLQLVSNWEENPELHKKAFVKAFDNGIETPVLQRKFADRVAKGDVIDLGEDVVVITDDGTPQPPTGVSPINSGIEGGEIAFIISFVHKDNYEGWKENNLPKEDKE